jgi:hypothetical protein
VLSRPSAPAVQPGPRYRDQPDATPLTAAAPPAAADAATPIALAASRAVAASLAAQRAPATGTSSANASREAGRPASAADRSGGDDDHPSPAAPKMLVVPEVVAFRPKRTGQASHTPAAPHEMAAPGPAPALGPPPGALDHLAAGGTSPAPWTVGDVPGQPTVTDTAV